MEQHPIPNASDRRRSDRRQASVSGHTPNLRNSADRRVATRDSSARGATALLETDRIIDLTVFDTPISPIWPEFSPEKAISVSAASTTTIVPPGAATGIATAPIALAPSATAPSATAVHPLVTLVAVATLLFLAISSGQLLALAVVGALAGMIFLHELGHFLTARLTNTKATEFFIGFGPRLWSFRRGETEYGIKAIPLGGYVKILGMTNLDVGVAPEDEARTYRQASYPARVLMAGAGTGMHLILAFVLFMAMFAGTGRLVAPAADAPAVVNVENVGPAATGGMKSGDRIVSVNGELVGTWSDLRSSVQRNAAHPIDVVVRRNGSLVTTTVTPVVADGLIRIGVSQKLDVIRESVPTAIRKSTGEIVGLIPQTFVSLKNFFSPTNLQNYGKNLVEKPKSAAAQAEADKNRMMSPVGATRLLKDAARFDFRLFLEIFASINVFVGIFNMLPILPLDGGHVLIATYERLRSRPKRNIRHRVDVSHWLPVTYAVMAVMLLLSLSSIYLDVRSPIKIF